MTRLLRRFLLPALFALSPAVPATEVGGLYEAVVPVTGQSPAERSRAAAEGFRQVLVKVAGQRSVLSLPALQPELGKAESLLGSFRYEAAPAKTPGQIVDPQLASLRLRLQFDPASVRALLNRVGAPLWGANRQPLHVWVVRGENGGTLLTLGTPQVDSLIDAAGQRGLSAVLPSPGDTRAPAGARVALLATLSPAAGRMHAAGTLRIDGVDEHVEASGNDDFSTLRELLAQAADRLGARYAVVARSDQLHLVRLQVSGIDRLDAYAALEHWLGGLPVVRDLMPEKVGGDRVTFVLTLAGDPARLVQAMTADGRFSEIGTPAADSPTQSSLDAVLGSGSLP